MQQHHQIFVNLAVDDLPKSKAFFAELGFGFNAQFTNEQAASLEIGPNIYAMLLQRAFFETFTDKPVIDARQSTEVLLCLSCQSREEVDAQVAKAVAAGGSTWRPVQDYGFMYGHGFVDLDGHRWELMYMDLAAAPKQM